MLTFRKRLFQRGYPAAVQTTRSLLLCAYVTMYKGSIHYSASFPCTSCLGQGQCCRQEAASESAVRHSSELVLVGITTRLLPQWAGSVAACPPSLCSGASIFALLPGWANVHWNGTELLLGFQKQNWAPINLLLISTCSHPSAQDQPAGINSVTPGMVSGTSHPGPPGRNGDFPTSTVLDKETAPKRQMGIQSCSLHWLQLTGRCSQRSGRMLPKRKQQTQPLHSTSPMLPKVQLTALTTKTILHPCKKWSPAREGKKPGIYSWLCKHPACSLSFPTAQTMKLMWKHFH